MQWNAMECRPRVRSKAQVCNAMECDAIECRASKRAARLFRDDARDRAVWSARARREDRAATRSAERAERAERRSRERDRRIVTHLHAASHLQRAQRSRLCPPARPPACPPAAAELATLEVVCSTALSFGEQSEAASPLDPAFHAIHPTLERIWQYRVLAGGVSDYSWPTASADLCIFGASAGRARRV